MLGLRNFQNPSTRDGGLVQPSLRPAEDPFVAGSTTDRQHVAELERLMTALNHMPQLAPGMRLRLRDLCKAKAEIILSGEEAHALRTRLNARRSA